MIDFNFYIEKFKAIDIKKRYLIFFGILIFVFFLDLVILMRPQFVALGKINRHISTQSKQLLEARSNIKKEKQLKREVESLQEQIFESRIQVVPKEEVPLVLEIISRLAEKNSISVDQLVPQTENALFLSQDKTRKYYVLAVIFKARSGYHNFGRFLNEIENHSYYFNIADFSMKSIDNSRLLNIVLTLNIIIYEELKK